MNINKDIYKANWLLYKAYEILKDKNIIDDQYKDILLDITTLLTNYILIDDGIEEPTEECKKIEFEVNEEIEDLISELENKKDINNINDLNELKNNYTKVNKINYTNNNIFDDIINNPSEETKKEVDKLLDELNKELNDL